MKAWLFLGVGLTLAGCAFPLRPIDGSATVAAFEQIRTNPPRLRMFLAAMPKGADLHMHLAGAVYAESNIEAGMAAGDCLSRASQGIVPPPCDSAASPPLSEVVMNRSLGALAIDWQSMRNFHPTPGLTAHDQFFQAFGRLGPSRKAGNLLAEVLNQAGSEHVRHVEVMTKFAASRVEALASDLPWSGSFDMQFEKLEQRGLAALVNPASAEVDRVIASARKIMDCAGVAPQPGCAVSLGLLQEINRGAPPEMVAAQIAFAFMLAAANPHIVGINIDSPEDSFIALRDYSLHMSMIGAIAQRYPTVGVALHAGELTLGLVPPDQLRSHIREAIEVGRAQRIGHGLDVAYEDEAMQLLHEMARAKVAVEICLTSNDLILGVRGTRHPFPLYMQEAVPTVLSTDDAGIERIDLTHEYERAVSDYHLDYKAVKALSRRSLEYSFLPGASLWDDIAMGTMVSACSTLQGNSCNTYLASSVKASQEWNLEQDFLRFEASFERAM